MHFRFSAPPLPALRFPRFALRSLCVAFRISAFPFHRNALLFLAYPLPRGAVLCPCSSAHSYACPLHIEAVLCLCISLRYHSVAVSSSHGLASPSQSSASPSHCVTVLLDSTRCRFIAVRRQTFLAAYALPLPPTTLPSASSSSQRNLPLPLLRHCPRPRYMP